MSKESEGDVLPEEINRKLMEGFLLAIQHIGNVEKIIKNGSVMQRRTAIKNVNQISHDLGEAVGNFAIHMALHMGPSDLGPKQSKEIEFSAKSHLGGLCFNTFVSHIQEKHANDDQDEILNNCNILRKITGALIMLVSEGITQALGGVTKH